LLSSPTSTLTCNVTTAKNIRDNRTSFTCFQTSQQDKPGTKHNDKANSFKKKYVFQWQLAVLTPHMGPNKHVLGGHGLNHPR
jgi:hypothetical protein